MNFDFFHFLKFIVRDKHKMPNFFAFARVGQIQMDCRDIFVGELQKYKNFFDFQVMQPILIMFVRS